MNGARECIQKYQTSLLRPKPPHIRN